MMTGEAVLKEVLHAINNSVSSFKYICISRCAALKLQFWAKSLPAGSIFPGQTKAVFYNLHIFY